METEFKRTFGEDLIAGLNQKNKRLHSKYLYDEKGDFLFQQIMKLDDYYLTRSEFEIFSMQAGAISQAFKSDGTNFELVEFGAGDGLKTKILLKALLDQEVDFTYIPIDISKSVLHGLEKDLKSEFPQLKLKIKPGTYFEAINSLSNDIRKVILFLGSNVGNFTREEANAFIQDLSKSCSPKDLFFIGVDLKKHPQTILNAYNDKQGVTRAFNLNLLKRINNTFAGDFDLQAFDHYPMYDPERGEAKSYLVSRQRQKVCLKDLDFHFELKAGECLFVEVSRKYDLEEIESLAHDNGFEVKKHFMDCKAYFVNSLWEKR